MIWQLSLSLTHTNKTFYATLTQKQEEEERQREEEEIRRAEEKRAKELYMSLEQEQKKSEQRDKEWEEQCKWRCYIFICIFICQPYCLFMSFLNIYKILI